ncbi:MAG: IS630-like element ISMac18 family transposase [Rhodothermales bacterium]
MPTKYTVQLNDHQRDELDQLIRTGHSHARKLLHARILLLSDTAQDGPAWTDEKIADALGCGSATVARTRRRFVTEGIKQALRVRKTAQGRPLKIDGVAEAHLIALACSAPPEGHARWSVRLLADRYVTLGLEAGWLEAPVSRETVRQTLKKQAALHRVKQWVIPPKQSARFVADMKRVLDLYAEPYDARYPVICIDERPCALVGESRPALPLRPGDDMQQDHEYTRGGLCCATMAFEPLRGHRQIWVRSKRRRVEFAEIVQELVAQYPEAERIRLVCDQLNTHTAASFYERFAPAEARRLAKRVEFVHPPVHGSWLSVVEMEFSVLVRQCLGHRRLGTVEALRREAEAWVEQRNRAKAQVKWQFTTADARVKLRRLYPSM